MLVKYVSIDGIPQAFLFSRFVDIIVITVHGRFWKRHWSRATPEL
jgi:G:T-mismatch repair DNA endonuclease (very short patch repair protein)